LGACSVARTHSDALRHHPGVGRGHGRRQAEVSANIFRHVILPLSHHTCVCLVCNVLDHWQCPPLHCTHSLQWCDAWMGGGACGGEGVCVCVCGPPHSHCASARFDRSSTCDCIAYSHPHPAHLNHHFCLNPQHATHCPPTRPPAHLFPAHGARVCPDTSWTSDGSSSSTAAAVGGSVPSAQRGCSQLTRADSSASASPRSPMLALSCPVAARACTRSFARPLAHPLTHPPTSAPRSKCPQYQAQRLHCRV
jgi:hypothetical protein